MRIFCLSFISSLLLLFGGCKNELDILDDYHPALVIYGILNPADTVQYVRVSRVFIGEGNAMTFAQTQDSIGFPPGTMQVKIEQWKNDILWNTYFLNEDTLIPRDSGVFVYPHQVIFRLRFPVVRDGSIYKITATDLARGITAKAETPIVQDVLVIEPSNVNSPLNLEDTTNIRIQFKSGFAGLRYRATLRFHYTEQFIFDTTEISEHYVDWDLGGLDAPNDEGGQTLFLYPQRNNFLRMLSLRIPENNFVRRISGKIDLIFIGAAQDFATYLNVQVANSNSPTSFPIYTNVTGGYGLFSARTTSTFPGYSLDSDTRYEMHISEQTQSLNFIR